MYIKTDLIKLMKRNIIYLMNLIIIKEIQIGLGRNSFC